MAHLIFTDVPGNWRTGHDFPAVPLTRVSWDTAPETALAYVFFGHVNIDYDGSPTAYGPDGIKPDPDDYLTNAGDDAQGWYGLLALSPDDPLVKQGTVILDMNPALNKKGKYPVIQQAANGDPAPGYYVSTTPHANGPAYLQSSYIDASQIAFGALAGKFASLGVNLGDYGLAIRHDKNLQSGFYFLDKGGNTYALGECSKKVGTNLGGSGRGDYFNNNFPTSFIVFPGSGTEDPTAVPAIGDAAIQTALMPLLDSLVSADNARDLVLLMALNETAPPNKPQGTSKLAAYLALTNPPSPKHSSTILQGLQAFGFTAQLAFSDDTSDDSSSPDSSTPAEAVAMSDGAGSGDASDSPEPSEGSGD